MSDFNHFDERGQARMVDVGDKEPTLREAHAEAFVQLGDGLLAEVLDHGSARNPKGDVLGTARLAGIAATKKTSDLIPLAHPLALHFAAIDLEPADAGIRVVCRVRAHDRTGVEMEAMTGATVAALTIYDMCKGRDRTISITAVRLLYKAGGRSGVYRADAP